MCIPANASKLFCMAHLVNAFYTILTIHLQYQILYACKLESLNCRKSTEIRERAFYLGNE